MTRLLVTGELLADSTEKETGMLEFAEQADITSLPSPRILNTHVKLSLLPPDIVKKRCKIIYLVRNPKDVVVSYYNFNRRLPYYEYTGKWENYVRHSALGKCT